MKRKTIKDIASECDVSLSTASLVLNNNPRISEKHGKRSLPWSTNMTFSPIISRGLASKSSHIVSVVVPDLNHVFADVYFGEIVSGIHEGASEENYKVMLDIANTKFVHSCEYINMLKSRRADGILFIASTLQDEYLKIFEHAPYPSLYWSTITFPTPHSIISRPITSTRRVKRPSI